jgi:DNA-binding CsgD family transcriptional regulator
MPIGSSDLGRLLGRADEVELLTSLLDGAGDAGGALVIRGEPGVGKSQLLSEAAALARDRGFSVLSTVGVQSEAHLAFAGLHQLLRPVRSRMDSLPSAQRAALDAAFGITDAPAPERFRIAMAALDLLCEVAADEPLLILVEDAQWLDRPSCEVLAFIARRVQSDPIVLLAAAREGYPSPLVDAGLREYELAGLAPAAAVELLGWSAATLSASLRERILGEAAGNPLALIELPVSVGRAELVGSETLPLTERLERAFAARVSDLPAEAQLLLDVAALSDEGSLREILAAGSAIAGSELGIDGFEPAVHASIVTVDTEKVRFRHPLMRSAVRQRVGLANARRIHEALAEVLRDDPDRRVWHRAAPVSGVHEEIAAELEQAAVRARRRGALAVAVSALRRAAELTEASGRARLLIAAAELAFELGQRDAVADMLSEVALLDPDPLERARAAWIEEVSYTRPLPSGGRAEALLAAATQAGEAGDRNLQLDLLWLLASRAWWVDPPPATRDALVQATSTLGDPQLTEPRVLAIQAYADPLGSQKTVLERVRVAAAGLNRDPDAARFLGPAAVVVGAFDVAVTLLASAADGLRMAGRLGHLPRLLLLEGSMAARVANWDVAIPAAEECRRLASELGEPQWVAAAETVDSIIAGTRGDEDGAERASAAAEGVAVPTGANITVAFAQTGRVLAALGAGRHADAYAIAERLFDPTSPAFHPIIAFWLIGDLAEAAAHIGRIEEARARVERVEAAGGGEPGTCVAFGLLHARAVLAVDEQEAAGRFAEALRADFTNWPLQRARLLLTYGQWLRRQRRVADSRAPLRDARDAFDAMGCAAWAEQARRELRATGEASRRRDPVARDRLTAQELQIARMAAQGLSNREIGERLYLSHRTVGTHLYRVFPKLGITARGDLSEALAMGVSQAR